MYWCDPPSWDADFSIRTGDGDPAADSKLYRPGGLTYIHIRALKMGLKYRGLLLYAQNSEGKKVGSWELPKEDEISFHTPPGSCEERAVMHSGADQKNYHNVFAFRAPTETNTGPITFKALLKTGEANLGAFHWPQSNAGGANPLTLTQFKKGPLNNWLLATGGKSCDDVCGGVDKVCNAALVGKITSTEAFQKNVGKEYVCKLPILGACSEVGPFQWKSRDFCFYQRTDPKCTTKVKCDASQGRRFCPCKTETKLSEQWTETNEKDSWADERDSWAELAETEASVNHAAMRAGAECTKYYTEPDCQAAGCLFSEQEGMVLCTDKASGPSL